MADKQALTLLRSHHTKGAPLALALSGGPDSMALLHLLLAYQKEEPFELHIIHVDHGWREESGSEAKKLEKLGLPFHLKRLERMASRDVENSARLERLAFFGEVMKKTGVQAVCLGHHSDDLAESVLKRVCEGAHMHHLGAFGFEKKMNELLLWRPWISSTKEEVLAYLDGKEAFVDASNDDERFLRARLGKKILPSLEKSFGKGIRKNLCWLSQKASLLDAYLERKCGGWLSQKTPYFADFAQAELLEVEYVLSRIGAFSREEIGAAAHLILSGAAHRMIQMGKKSAVIHKKTFLLLEEVGGFEVEYMGEIRAAPLWHRLWTEGGYWPVGDGDIVQFCDLEKKMREHLVQKPLFKSVPSPLRKCLPVSIDSSGPFKKSLFLRHVPSCFSSKNKIESCSE